MGGKVFTDLMVPRLPHDVYNAIRLKAHEALKPFYKNIVSPPEAPSKLDHGDIDFLVADPLQPPSPDPKALVKAISSALGAVDFKHTSNSKTTHFALPVPGREKEYAQVDVHVCSSEFFLWEIFLQSYGDLLQIVGLLNRPAGFTINDKGLFLRIPEIEPGNRKKAMVFLTSLPSETMKFLGLDVSKYEAGFATNEEVFAWCFEGKYYKPLKEKEETSNDRDRLRKRDMFTTCVKEWFPAHSAKIFPEERKLWTREAVLAEALESFPHARPVYEEKMAEYKQEIWEAEILADMRKAVPGAEEKEITEVVRGSKRFVAFDEGAKEWVLSDTILHEEVAARPAWMDYVKTEEEKTKFLEWLRDNWVGVHRRERERMKGKGTIREASKMAKLLSLEDGS